MWDTKSRRWPSCRRRAWCSATSRRASSFNIAGDTLPVGYKEQLGRYRYGMGAFKLDWALDGPIPWKSPEVARAGTVHLGGTRAEISASEHAAASGKICDTPYILLAQQSLLDDDPRS